MNTQYHLYIHYYQSLTYDFGKMSETNILKFFEEDIFIFFNSNEFVDHAIDFSLYAIQGEQYYTNHINITLEEHLYELLDQYAKEKYNFFTPSYLTITHKNHYYWLLVPFKEPFYLDVSPLRFFYNEQGHVVILGLCAEELDYHHYLQQCWQTEFEVIDIRFLEQENLKSIRYGYQKEYDIWNLWENVAGDIIQVIKKHNRYLIINGFSIYIRHLKMNKKQIKVQMLELTETVKPLKSTGVNQQTYSLLLQALLKVKVEKILYQIKGINYYNIYAFLSGEDKLNDNKVLSYLIEEEDTDLLMLLSNVKAEILERKCHEETMLIYASKTNRMKIVQFLLAHGAEINAKNRHGQTALMLASWLGHREIVQVLLAHKPEINTQDNEGLTALIYAVGMNYKEIVKSLLVQGANIRIRMKNSETALQLALVNNSTEIVQILKVNDYN